MIAHFVICVLGGHDLLQLAIASIHKFAGDSTVDLIELPDTAVGDRHAHGRALDRWVQDAERDPIPDDDVVIVMDPDVAILSPVFRPRMDAVFANPEIGIWGAGCTEDFGKRVHPMLMAIRGKAFNESARLETTFRPLYLPEDDATGNSDWRDTGGWYCKCAVARGWSILKEERALGYDWHGAAAWYDLSISVLRTAWDHERLPNPLFAHLGGGTWSDPARMTWFQKLKNRRAIARRRGFISAVENVLRQA